MKKFLYISFLLINSFATTAQENSIRVIYKPIVKIDFDTIKGPRNFIDFYKRSINKAKYLSFELISNDDSSVSQFKEIDGINLNLTKIDEITLNTLINLKGIFTNMNNQYLIHDYNIQSENLKVKIEKPIKWTVTQEKKKS